MNFKPLKFPAALVAVSSLFLTAWAQDAGAQVVINEVDADQPSSDTEEFVELYDGGVGNTSLDGYVLVLYNGSNTLSYRAVGLDGFATDNDGFLVIGSEIVQNVDVILGGSIQNGEDAVALYNNTTVAAFPNGTEPVMTNLVDVLVHSAGGDNATALQGIFGVSAQEEYGANGVEDAIARLPDGASTFVAQGPTPGRSNVVEDEIILIFSDLSISENGGTTTGEVLLTTANTTGGAITVDLENPDGSELSLPAGVEIPDGATTSGPFSVTAVNDLWADGQQVINVNPVAAGYISEPGAIVVLDDDGDGPAPVIVNEIHAAVENAAGDANQDGDVDFSDDEFVEIVNASSTDPFDLSGFTLADNSGGTRHTFPAGTILSPDCAIVVFGGGAVAEGRSTAFGGAIIQKASEGFIGLNDPGDFVSIRNLVGDEVSGANYTSSSSSPFADGGWTRNPDLTGDLELHPGVPGAGGAFHSAGVKTDGGTPFCPVPEAVTVTLNPATITEDDGAAAATATVTLPVPATEMTTINLSSSDTSEATVPAIAMIPVGESSVVVDIDALDDEVPDGPQSVEISASVTGLLDGTATLTVNDDGDFNPVVINEFLADPAPDYDANEDGNASTSQDEFVEIINNSASVLDLSGWTISDAVAVRHEFPEGTLVDPGCAILVFGGGSPAAYLNGALVQTASDGALGLNNTGDTITLSDGISEIISINYSSGTSDQSFTLDPDITGLDYVGHTDAAGSNGAIASPGTRIDGTPFCTAAGSSYVAWATAFPGLGEPEDDLDCDGLINSMEYAVGGNPLVPDEDKGVTATVNGNGEIVLSLNKGIEAGADPGVIYSVESSNDMISWNSIGITIATNDATSLVATYDTTGPPRRYLRVRVVLNP